MKPADSVLAIIRDAGAQRMALLAADRVPFDPSFRALCRANSCGNYGKYYTCPPAAGEIDQLIARAKAYAYAVLYQTVWPLQDSYDVEGMAAAGRGHCDVAQRIQQRLPPGLLHLATGGCRLCGTCALQAQQPCVYPDRALTSMSAYGIYVAKAARAAGLPYINGANTVTYFGMVWMGAADARA